MDNNKKLRDIIKDNWGISYKHLDESTPLISISEQIACDSEKCTIEEAYNLFIDNPNLHLPGLISFYIIDELGLDVTKINGGMTLDEIFSLLG